MTESVREREIITLYTCTSLHQDLKGAPGQSEVRVGVCNAQARNQLHSQLGSAGGSRGSWLVPVSFDAAAGCLGSSMIDVHVW